MSSIIQLLYSRTYLIVAVNLLHSRSDIFMTSRILFNWAVWDQQVFYIVPFFNPHAQREQGKVIGCGVHIYISEYGSTPYVGLASAVSSTNTNFWLTFLLT